MQLDPKTLHLQNKFFRHFQLDEVKKLLEHGVVNRFSAGEVIFWEGDMGEAMYVILSGQVEILLKTGSLEEILTILGPGDVFGEGSFASKKPRTAKAMATKDTFLYVITRPHLDELIEKAPKVVAKLLMEILQIVCERLHVTNQKLKQSS